MPRFRMTYPYARSWAVPLACTPPRSRCEPADVVEADENPDPNHFEEVAEKKSKAEASADAETEE